MKTRTIAGIKVTLKAGNRYRASRPMGPKKGTLVPVKITNLESSEEFQILNVSYDKSNDFLGKFNNGKSSFAGRLW